MFTQDNNELAFDVEFLSCVIDKTDNLKVVDCDSHFCDFVGVHPSKIKQGKLFLHDILIPQDREAVMRKICSRNSPYVYMDIYLKDKKGNFNLIHCTGRNSENSPLCQMTFADVSRSIAKSKKLRAEAKTMNHLIDFVTGGVCLFKVNRDMHFEVLYANEACCRFFGTTKENVNKQDYRIDELIHPEDKSAAFQAIGVSMATKKPIDMELRIITHRDEYMWCKMNSDIQRYDKDNCPIFHAIFSDITEIKKAERKADSQSEMLIKIFKNLPGPIFCSEYENPFKLDIVSEDFLKLIGCSRTEFFDYFDGDLARIISEDQSENAGKSLASQFSEGKRAETDYIIKSSGGGLIEVRDRRKVVELESGEKTIIGYLCDISSDKNL